MEDEWRHLGRRLRALRKAAGITQTELARRIPCNRPGIVEVEKGDRKASEPLCEGADRVLQTGGELAALRRRLVAGQRTEEVGPADRRQLFEFGAAGFLAAETFRRRARTGPDVLTLAELDKAVVEHAKTFTSTPHDVLAPVVYRTWQSADLLLEAGAKPTALTRLTRVAGYAAYFLARLAFNVADDLNAERFVTLASDYASEVNDKVLSASVAEALSTLAFYGHRYAEAAEEARRGAVLFDDPYLRARLAAYEARAKAADGDVEGTRLALARMRKAAVDMPTQPGASPFGPVHADQSTARCLVLLGAGAEAEPLARAAVDHYERRGGGYEDHGNALLNLAGALVSRPNPQPDEAAHLASRVVGMLDTRPTFSVTDKIGDVGRSLAPYAELPPVRELFDQIASRPRLALTA